MRKLLIANRGEIACRIIATARRMEISTVAVFSEADAEAQHVARADEAICIGPAEAAKSYLNASAVLGAARATGADAIHPGYGFLSENAGFAEAVTSAGLTWVGPPARAIRAMGLKDAAKTRMELAGVPVVPGYRGDSQDATVLADEAAKIGYPVLIKARAGGGGKGMRRVDAPPDFAAALTSARSEAQAAFGDPACLIEKFVTAPRHIEIQIFGDAHGNVLHMHERDCSLQRRHQKVIEEAPAPGMPPEMRAAMGAAAVEAARAIGYVGAGTVEFIVDGSRGLRPDGFWFMEMNTRLQVEHPVSEAITGLDFVALQLDIARGRTLPLTQADVPLNGHAIEARLYAEDPSRGFLPATGQLTRLRFPQAAHFAQNPVRVDSGVTEGDRIGTEYDPMIAKLIVHAPDRATALRRMDKALADTRIAGVTTNLDFLGALVRHDGFAAGEVDTGLIDREAEVLTDPGPPPDWLTATAAVLALRGGPWPALADFRAWGIAERLVTLGLAGQDAQLLRVRPGRVCIVGLDDAPVEITLDGTDPLTVRHAGRMHRVARLDGGLTLRAEGRTWRFVQPDPLGAAGAEAAGDTVTAPMPGTVRRVFVQAGAVLAKGDPIAVLEAMKMEHTLIAPRDGVLEILAVAEGDRIEDGELVAHMAVEE